MASQPYGPVDWPMGDTHHEEATLGYDRRLRHQLHHPGLRGEAGRGEAGGRGEAEGQGQERGREAQRRREARRGRSGGSVTALHSQNQPFTFWSEKGSVLFRLSRSVFLIS